MSLKISRDEFNKLLQRREIICTFKSAAGLLTRQDAVKSLAKKIRVDAKKVHLLGMKTRSGTRDISGAFYVFDNEAETKKQLPRYPFLRALSREDRKKLLEEAKKAKPAPPEKK